MRSGQATPGIGRRKRARRLVRERLRGALVAYSLSVSLLAAAGCATGPNLSADYGQTARENYVLALAEFEDRDWEESVEYADFVRIRFPFSRYAVESELLIARAQFEAGEFVVAQDAFKQFARLHPTHEHVRNGWVAYMAAVSAYMASPESFFILPPHFQRDQSLLREALDELDYFWDHYGDTKLAPLAKELENIVKRKLLEHELYVARFYLDRERPEAAIGRLESAHATYPGIGLDAEVLFLLGVTYLRVDEVELARNTFSELQAQHPGHHHGKQARLYLKHIQDTYGPADPNRARPPRPRPRPVTPARPKPEASKSSKKAGKNGKKVNNGESVQPATPSPTASPS